MDNAVGTEQPDIDLWVNQGVQQVLMDTRCYVTSTAYTVSALTAAGSVSGDYTIPAAILDIEDLYFTSGSLNYRLEQLPVPELIERRRLSAVSASPTQFYALAGANLLMFHPAPASTDTVTIYYVPVPTALSASGDDPSTTTLGGVPVQLHKAIEYYALAEAADYDDDQTSAQGQRYRDMYDKEISRARRFLKRRKGQRLARAQVNGIRRNIRQHRNDLYPGGA